MATILNGTAVASNKDYFGRENNENNLSSCFVFVRKASVDVETEEKQAKFDHLVVFIRLWKEIGKKQKLLHLYLSERV